MASDDITLLACITIVAVPVFAVSARMVIRAITDSLLRVRGASRAGPALQPADPQVAALQAELEELRAQMERVTATEAFYAQLQAPATPHPAVTTS